MPGKRSRLSSARLRFSTKSKSSAFDCRASRAGTSRAPWIQHALAGQRLQREERHHAGQRIVGAVQQAPVPLAVREDRGTMPRAVRLRDRRRCRRRVACRSCGSAMSRAKSSKFGTSSRPFPGRGSIPARRSAPRSRARPRPSGWRKQQRIGEVAAAWRPARPSPRPRAPAAAGRAAQSVVEAAAASRAREVDAHRGRQPLHRARPARLRRRERARPRPRDRDAPTRPTRSDRAATAPRAARSRWRSRTS